MKRRFELTYLPIGPMARMIFFLNVIFGVIIGIVVGAVLAMLTSFGVPITDPNLSRVSPGLLMIILPIVYAFLGGIFGTLFYVIFVWFYNMIARFAGGMVIELEELQDDDSRTQISSSGGPIPPPSGATLPWSMPSNMSSTIGGTPEAPYRPPSPPSGPEDDTTRRS